MADKLNAVNTILGAIEAQAVSSLVTTDNEVGNAIRILDSETMDMLLEGFNVSTNLEKEITPDGGGFINLLSSYLNVIPIGTDLGRKWYQKGLKLFNREENTDVFTLPVTLRIYELMDFEEIPLHLGNYITARAARRFSLDMRGARQKDSFLLEREVKARLAMEEAEYEQNTDSARDDPWLNEIMGGRGGRTDIRHNYTKTF